MFKPARAETGKALRKSEPLNVLKARKRASAARANLKTLAVSYVVLMSVLMAQFVHLSDIVVGVLAVIGLAAVGVTHWLQGKKVYSVIYRQELQKLESLIALGQQKKVNSKNIIGAVEALAASVDAKDHYTYGHSEKVAGYAVEIARSMGCSHRETENIRIAARLHDIGKIGISDQLLNKQGMLTPADREELSHHPERGAGIIKCIEAIRDCVPIVLHHHERFDGKGYPEGLAGESIPLGARILAVADTIDAITSERPYRRSRMTLAQALDELELCAGEQFDPQVVNAANCLKPGSFPVLLGHGALPPGRVMAGADS